MNGSIRNAKINEATRNRDWCIFILNFMQNKCGSNDAFSSYSEIVNQAYDKQIFRSLKSMVSDVNEWAGGLPQFFLDELNVLLLEKFGENLDKKKKAILKKISRFLKDGYIKNDDEFRMVEARIDEIYNDESRQEECNALNNLLVKYYEAKRI